MDSIELVVSVVVGVLIDEIKKGINSVNVNSLFLFCLFPLINFE